MANDSEKRIAVQDIDDSTASESCVTRRKFLLGSGAVVATTIMLPALPGMGGSALAAEIALYPRQLIGSLSKLKVDEPVIFKYPDKGRNSRTMLVKLGEEAGGGIGPDMDIVAFNTLCTHMGGDMSRTYLAEHKILGPCPFHQSTFDMTRHGIIIAGHATESLPQVLLELDGDDIYATGLIGLIYGRYDNLKS
jgi:arsenite oxidase small subunit